jgi:hypothetical protein
MHFPVGASLLAKAAEAKQHSADKNKAPAITARGFLLYRV